MIQKYTFRYCDIKFNSQIMDNDLKYLRKGEQKNIDDQQNPKLFIILDLPINIKPFVPIYQQQIQIEMKKNKKITTLKTAQKKKSINSRLKIPISEYSLMYRKYMMEQFPAADLMIKKIIQMPCCRSYYLKFPLEGLLRGAAKKMMLNTYQLGVFGFFLEQIDTWSIGSEIFFNLYQIFPDIIHVNEPTCQQQLKQLSMFLYFSSYSVKQLLNSNIEMYKKQMQKIFPEFQHLHIHWVNNQSTVNLALNPRALNEYFKRIQKITSMVDYNTCVDKIIQISPCYDLSGRVEKKKVPQFGYMESGNKGYLSYNNMILNGQNDVKMQMEPIDLMGDFKFDGGDL